MSRTSTFSAPILRSSLPSATKVLRSHCAYRVKLTSQAQTFELYVRTCANGSNQIPGLDFQDSYSPTAAFPRLLCIIALGSYEHMMVIIMTFRMHSKIPSFSTLKNVSTSLCLLGILNGGVSIFQTILCLIPTPSPMLFSAYVKSKELAMLVMIGISFSMLPSTNFLALLLTVQVTMVFLFGNIKPTRLSSVF